MTLQYMKNSPQNYWLVGWTLRDTATTAGYKSNPVYSEILPPASQETSAPSSHPATGEL